MVRCFRKTGSNIIAAIPRTEKSVLRASVYRFQPWGFHCPARWQTLTPIPPRTQDKATII